MGTFCEMFHLHSLVKSPICFKNPQNPSFKDLILTNCLILFMNMQTVELENWIIIYTKINAD